MPPEVLSSDQAKEAQLAKVSKERREREVLARDLIWQLRARLAAASVDVGDLDKAVLQWLISEQGAS
jgi:hypothetical protein